MSWSLDHVEPLSHHPDRLLDRTNCRAAHLKCNSTRGSHQHAAHRRAQQRHRRHRQLATTRNW
jgi:5-methylcytosine-specific restriction endonuclease McrA